MSKTSQLTLLLSAIALCSMMLAPASAEFIDDFESYTLGNLAGQAGVDGNTWIDFGGTKLTGVSNARSHGGQQSMMQELDWAGGYGSDIILQFGNPATDVEAGKWTFAIWQFIESDENFDGTAHMYLSRDVIQPDGTGFAEGSWMVANGGTGNIEYISGAPASPILVKNQWAELRWDIDFDNNVQDFYYDGTLVRTADWVPAGQAGNTFSSLNFWVDAGATSNARVYFDDWSLQIVPEPSTVTLALCGLLALFCMRRRWS